MKRFATIEKQVGETPLEATLRLREKLELNSTIPLAYAGRLDPMASGKLLVLIGNECKRQEKYHALDKEYIFEILFGIQSDTGDVLGITKCCESTTVDEETLRATLEKFIGTITLPYPHFSAKTVRGKPLHMWTLEKRLTEIEIPMRKSRIYKLELLDLRTLSRDELFAYVSKKIESIPKVEDERKALGRDFRRDDVRKSWSEALPHNSGEHYCCARLRCIASSGTYMRSLAGVIAQELDTCGLALSIHRTTIGKYISLLKQFGFWWKTY